MDQVVDKIQNMTREQLKVYFDNEKIETLHKIKLYADDIYYNTGEFSGLSDWSYDMLKETLEKRDPDYVVPVGAKLREGENKAELPFWLGSMDKLKPDNAPEIARWIYDNNADSYVIEDKLDGVSCLYMYESGQIKLYKRGDGTIGTDISYLSQYIPSIPKKLNQDINVRGELIMKNSVFEKKYSKNYASARNMVSGRTGAKTARKGINDIEFVAYEIVGDGIMMKPSDQFKLLKKLGFKVVNHEFVNNFDIDSLSETLLRFKETSPYEIDGIIVQPDKEYERNTSGNPEYAFAFKMLIEGNVREAEVIGVDWNVSKWGQLKPRVEIKPVIIGGNKITWATGFNAKFIQENMIGNGAIVQITRSGEVIPYIIKVIKKASEPDMPDLPYDWNETGVDIVTTEFGDDMCIKLIANFFAKIGVKHVGEKNVKKLYSAGFDTLIKIIAAKKEDFQNVQGFGTRLAERTYDNIHENLQNLSLPNVLGSSGIFGFGLGRKKITTLFNEIPNLLEIYKNMSQKQLLDMILKVEGFSDKTAIKIVKNISWADKFIEAMKHFGTFEEKQVVNDSLKGIKVVFSGFRDKNLEEDVVARGGKVMTSVSRNTNILVVSSNSKNPTGKVKKAMDLGVKVLEKQEFIDAYI